MNATFKMVKDPFYQALLIHAFIRKGSSFKQLPLVCSLISCNTKHNHQAVLKQLLQIIGDCQVKEIVFDFESAVWTAIRIV